MDFQRSADGFETPHAEIEAPAKPTEAMLLPRHDGRFKKGNRAGARRALTLVKLDSVMKIRRTLWAVVADLRRGALRADVANAAIGGLRLLLELHEVEQQDARVAAMSEEVERLKAQLAERLGADGRALLEHDG